MSTVARIGLVFNYIENVIKGRHELLMRLAAAGLRTTVFGPPASSSLLEQLAAYPVTYCAIDFDRTGLNPVHDLRTLSQLWEGFRAHRVDAVLALSSKAIVYASLAARLARVPRFVSLITGLGWAFSGTSPRQRALRTVSMGLYRLSTRLSDVVLVQNEDDASLFRELAGPRRESKVWRISGSGVNLTHFSPVPLPPQPAFLFMTRLMKSKGVVEYVEAARALRQRHPYVEFALAGWIDEGPDAIPEKWLREWIDEGTIIYHGHLDDVRPALARCSVYVHPSAYREGIPRSALEAMAMARPVVTTDAVGCRETVRHGETGLLIPPRDTAALVAALERFIVEPDLALRLGRSGRDLAEAHFDVEQVATTIHHALVG